MLRACLSPVRRMLCIGRCLVCAAAISLGLLAGPLLLPSAHAELTACYDDPVVVLSDGTTLDLGDTIYDWPTDVQQVSYTVHAPAGITAVSIQPSTGPLGPKETFTFTSAGALHQYAIETAVRTGTAGIGVSASVTAVQRSGASSASVTGLSNQWLEENISL